MISLLLRALSLGSKFLLVIYLAKRLTPEDMGIYGLFTASVSYSLYLLGVDYYAFANREMMGRPESHWPLIMRDQAIFYCISYIVSFPLLCLIFITDLISWKYFSWFYLILTFEHLAQESNRLLIAIQKPLQAGVILFVRAGAWAYVIIFVMIKNPDARALTTVWAGWLLGVFLSLIISCFMFRSLDWASVKQTHPDWAWIRTGVTKALPFFFSTLALRGIYTLDKYFLKYFWGETAVGVYSFYSGVANIVQYFVDAAIIVNYYPKLVSSYMLGNIKEYRIYLRQMTFAILTAVVIIIGFLGLCIGPLLDYIAKPVYSAKISVFWILLLANGVVTISYIPHYALYAIGRDKDIITSTILSFFICMTLYFCLTPYWGGEGVSVAIFISVVFLLIYKQFSLQRTSGCLCKK
ncbi:MAG: oligosaccharide flippase family protein [Desulfamplus sp.]|nr:oligosaccharide flippase family protein [Desulfamplus sp.]